MDKQKEHQLIERIVGSCIETNKRELGIDSLLPLWGFKGEWLQARACTPLWLFQSSNWCSKVYPSHR